MSLAAMRNGALVALLAVATAVAERPLPPWMEVPPSCTGQPFRPGAEEPSCAGQAKCASCWLELESHPGCFVWNSYLSEGETAAWSGECADGLASGTGTLKWAYGSVVNEHTGLLSNGKYHGHWVRRYSNGNVHEGPMVDGNRQGHWVVRHADGIVYEGPMVDDRRHGRWVRRDSNGYTIILNWVNGVHRRGHR